MAGFEVKMSVSHVHDAGADTRIVERMVAAGNPRFAAWELRNALTAIVEDLVRQFGDPEDRPANR